MHSCRENCPCGVTAAYRRADLRIFPNHAMWRDNLIRTVKARRGRKFKSDYALVRRCNAVHRGSKYIRNTPGFVIEARNANKWFFSKIEQKVFTVLHNINLNIREGEFVIVLGYSGSGKTTLLNMLSGLERPSNGTVIVADSNIISMSEGELIRFRRENLSFIFQSYALIPELTVRENILQGAFLQEDVNRRLDLDDLVNYLGIAEHLNKYPSQLSGGQQQRVSIAKSVIKNPRILFADEPTAAVDMDTCRNILEIFLDINRRYRTTIVLITHNPLITQIGTRLVYIERGRVVKCVKNKPLPLDQIRWMSSEYE